LISVVAGLAGQIIGLFGSKGKAQQQALKTRVANMKRSWTDELVALVWFSPMMMAWISPDRATAWIDTATADPEYYALLVGITAAVFGLGKINGRK